MPYTKISETLIACDDCGAYGPTEEAVKHHPTCKPGESEKWTKHYNEQEKEE